MSKYTESKKKIEAIRNQYGEFVFRGGISHLMDVGIRHLTEENVEHTCKEIMQSDDTGHFMTNEFKCELVKAAYELAQVSHIDLLVYIQREVDYGVFDGAIDYNRAIELLRNCINSLDFNYISLDDIRELGFKDEEIESLGYGWLFEEEDE